MNSSINPESLNRIAEQAVPDTLDLWPQIRSQIRTTSAIRPTLPVRRLALQRHGFGIGIAAAIVLTLVVGGISVMWNTPEVSAESILDRAQSSADTMVAAVQTYHLKMTRQVPVKGNATIDTEIWFGGSNRQRRTEQAKDASGAIISIFDVVINGPQVWMRTTAEGKTRVVHTTGTAWSDVADDPSRRNSLTDVLTQYNNGKACTNAQLRGEARVAGQAVYLIAVTPKPGACPAKAAIETRTAILQSQKPIVVPNQFGQMLVWVDKVSFVPLKTEVRDPSGVLLDQSEIVSVQYNITIPESVLAYTTPAGASVFEFTGGTGADVKAALCTADPALGCQSDKPSKKP